MPGAIQIVGTMMNYCASLPSIEPSFGKSDKACTSMQVLTSWNFSSIWPHSIEEKFVGSTPGSAGESATCEEVSHTFTDPAGFYGHAILQHMPGREDMLLYEELSMNSIHRLVKRSKLSPQGEREKHCLIK